VHNLTVYAGGPYMRYDRSAPAYISFTAQADEQRNRAITMWQVCGVLLLLFPLFQAHGWPVVAPAVESAGLRMLLCWRSLWRFVCCMPSARAKEKSELM
jgi:hypothetical protein